MTLDEAARRLAEAGVENARGEARLLLALALGVGRDEALAPPALSPPQHARFEAFVARRAGREPFAYIAGAKEFWSLNLAVGPGVLVPRPDTETLIEAALRLLPDRDAPLRIIDLGTGSGALLLAALREFPRATGVGLDSSAAALQWAARNAAVHAPHRADMRLGDWDNLAPQAFDLVFCNPPYIPSGDIAALEPEVARFEPRAALDGGADGLDAYRGLARLLPRLLRPAGFALLEIGIGQAALVEPLFAGLEMFDVASDLAGITRCVALRNIH